jgi:hypothetical protein
LSPPPPPGISLALSKLPFYPAKLFPPLFVVFFFLLKREEKEGKKEPEPQWKND